MFRAPLLVLSIAASRIAIAQTVAYDSISNFTPPQTGLIPGGTVQAEDTVLDPAAGLVLNRVELYPKLDQAASFTYTGLLMLRIYTSTTMGSPARPFPDHLLGTASLSITLGPGQASIASFDNLNIALPSREIWTAWWFANSTGTTPGSGGLAFNRQSTVGPAIGSTTPYIGTSASWNVAATTPSDWLSVSVNQFRCVRLTTIPEPGSAAALGLLTVLPRRRRR